ncbi:hypothetical protein P7C70_g9642, partial [Phenoliferia sp. Uapishka_3]
MVLQQDPESGEDIGYIEAYLICQEECGGHPFDTLPLPTYEEENEDPESEQEDSDVEGELRPENIGQMTRLARMGPQDNAGKGPASLRLGTRELDLAYDWRDKANLYLDAALMKSYINEMKKLSNGADDRELEDVDTRYLCGEQKQLFTKVVAHVDAHL